MRKKTSENKKGDIKNRLVKYYNGLINKERKQLIKQLKQDKFSLENRLAEKIEILDYLTNVTRMGDE